jgi:hypothetical protein
MTECDEIQYADPKLLDSSPSRLTDSHLLGGITYPPIGKALMTLYLAEPRLSSGHKKRNDMSFTWPGEMGRQLTRWES